jgi:hypothetical protein
MQDLLVVKAIRIGSVTLDLSLAEETRPELATERRNGMKEADPMGERASGCGQRSFAVTESLERSLPLQVHRIPVM